MELVTKIQANGDRAIYDRVSETIKSRYGGDLYEIADEDSAADIEVLVAAKEDSIYVIDAPRHELLGRLLIGEFGRDRATAALLEQRPEAGVSRFRYKINASAQVCFCEIFVAEVAGFLKSFFPIKSSDASLEMRLHDLKLHAPTQDFSSRWIVMTLVLLRDVQQGSVIDSDVFGRCNFFGARDNGRIAEPGHKLGRPFDEVPSKFRASIKSLLTKEIPSN